MAFLFAVCVAVFAFFGTNTFAASQFVVSGMGNPQDSMMGPVNGLGDSMFGSNGLDYDNNQLLTNQQVYAQPAMGGQTFMPAQNSRSFGNTMTFGQQAQTGSMFGQNSQSFGNTMSFGQPAQTGPMFGQQSSSPMIVPQAAGFGSPVMLAPQNAGLFAGNTVTGQQSNSLSSLLPILLFSGLGSSSSSSTPSLLLTLLLLSQLNGNTGGLSL